MIYDSQFKNREIGSRRKPSQIIAHRNSIVFVISKNQFLKNKHIYIQIYIYMQITDKEDELIIIFLEFS